MKNDWLEDTGWVDKVAKRCILCDRKATLFWSNWLWGGIRPNKEIYVESYCHEHLEEFLESYKIKIIENAGRFIFLRGDCYGGQCHYVTFEDLRRPPFRYSEEDIQILILVLDSQGTCERCEQNVSVVLMHIGVIKNTQQPPFIKDRALLTQNEGLCVDCFLKFLADEINQQKKFGLTLPHASRGIYLFEE